MEKNRIRDGKKFETGIRDKHPGSAALITKQLSLLKSCPQVSKFLFNLFTVPMSSVKGENPSWRKNPGYTVSFCKYTNDDRQNTLGFYIIQILSLQGENPSWRKNSG